MSNLNGFLFSKNIKVTEGNTGENILQRYEITNILKSKKFEKIMEIGFNAGHSSELFLSNTDAYVYSFDIGDHFNKYLKYGKIYINQTFPGRHTLVFGDSKITIPRFTKNNDIKFDLIFIDGGHDYDTAYADLINCRELAHNETIVIMDDIVKNPKLEAGYTIGPTKAWDDAVKLNLLEEISHSTYCHGRGQSVGKYIFN